MPRNKSWFFRQNALVSCLSRDDVEALVQSSESISLRKKRAVWMTGTPTDKVYWVRSGIVKVSKVTDDGRELTLQFHTKDDLFGEVAVFSPGAHDTTAEAFEDCVVYAVPLDVFMGVLRGNAELVMRLSRIVSERRQKLENRIGGLLFRTAHARLALLFLSLADDFGIRDARGVIINLKLTHKEMAALIGATRETVSFAILDLRRDGLILTEGKRVIIPDEAALRALLGG